MGARCPQRNVLLTPAIVLALLLVTSAGAMAQPGDAPLFYRVGRDAFTVTSGTVRESSAKHLIVDVPEVRAVLRTQTLQAAALRFTYLGPTVGSRPLASGEMRRQLGLKFRAQDTCNVVYVMWHIEPDSKIAASVKRNPGQQTHAQCGARGYTNVRPRRAVPISPIVPGGIRTLQATLRGNDLTVLVDGAIVWKGTLPAWIADFDGPVGFRSDNVRFEFEYSVGGLATPSLSHQYRQAAQPDNPAVEVIGHAAITGPARRLGPRPGQASLR